MQPIDRDIAPLLLKHLQGSSSDEEERYVAIWASKSPENKETLARLKDKKTLRKDLSKLYQLTESPKGQDRVRRIQEYIEKSVASSRSIRPWKFWMPYAAMLSIILTAGLMWLMTRSDHRTHTHEHVTFIGTSDIAPGGNAALEDGWTISLSQRQNGVVIDQELKYEG